jgi:hypothetical protein
MQKLDPEDVWGKQLLIPNVFELKRTCRIACGLGIFGGIKVCSLEKPVVWKNLIRMRFFHTTSKSQEAACNLPWVGNSNHY